MQHHHFTFSVHEARSTLGAQIQRCVLSFCMVKSWWPEEFEHVCRVWWRREFFLSLSLSLGNMSHHRHGNTRLNPSAAHNGRCTMCQVKWQRSAAFSLLEPFVKPAHLEPHRRKRAVRPHICKPAGQEPLWRSRRRDNQIPWHVHGAHGIIRSRRVYDHKQQKICENCVSNRHSFN